VLFTGSHYLGTVVMILATGVLAAAIFVVA